MLQKLTKRVIANNNIVINIISISMADCNGYCEIRSNDVDDDEISGIDWQRELLCVCLRKSVETYHKQYSMQELQNWGNYYVSLVNVSETYKMFH